ncbi:MAG TPA: hypothetical protein VMB76_05425 [Casimicrobiaceae bacterium]|jgi:hypothetical protein|nr:hypothetical protein [Casimicrobiaceae bacterium]
MAEIEAFVAVKAGEPRDHAGERAEIIGGFATHPAPILATRPVFVAGKKFGVVTSLL